MSSDNICCWSISLATALDDSLIGAQIRIDAGDYTINEEKLSVDEVGGITSVYMQEGDYYILTLSGAGTTAEYEQVLQSFRFSKISLMSRVYVLNLFKSKKLSILLDIYIIFNALCYSRGVRNNKILLVCDFGAFFKSYF